MKKTKRKVIGFEDLGINDPKITASVIEQTLKSFNIQSRVLEIDMGPAYTNYVLEVTSKADIDKIIDLSSDLALATKSATGRIWVKPIETEPLEIELQIPNKYLVIVPFDLMLEVYNKREHNYKLPVFLGLDSMGEVHYADLTELENILIAGTTGSGKSVFNNSLIWSLISSYTPEELKFLITDVKRVEFSRYNGMNYLMDDVHMEIEDVFSSLEDLVKERKAREKRSKDKKKPYIVAIIDTFSDMMMWNGARFEKIMEDLLPNSKDYGIHVVMCDSRPSLDVFSPKIQKLFPTRIAFNTGREIDSEIVVGERGAVELLGKGDMLFLSPEMKKPVRLQTPFISDKEIKEKIKNI